MILQDLVYITEENNDLRTLLNKLASKQLVDPSKHFKVTVYENIVTLSVQGDFKQDHERINFTIVTDEYIRVNKWYQVYEGYPQFEWCYRGIVKLLEKNIQSIGFKYGNMIDKTVDSIVKEANYWLENGPPKKFNIYQKEWINALIGNYYPQGHLCLNKDGKYCCLGVACEVYNDIQRRHKKKQLKVSGTEVTQYERQTGFLPNIVKRKFQFNSSFGSIICKIQETDLCSLVQLNDSLGLTHDEIGLFALNNPELVFESHKR